MIDKTKIKEHGYKLRREVKDKTLGYITAALGLVAGLAWNDAIKSLIEYFFPLTGNGIAVKFVYAVLITVFIVFLTMYLVKLMGEDEADSA